MTWDPGPRLDPLLAAAILFGPASIVLASASPIAVRLAASSLERLGRTAGRLFSISTAGSIFGTFVTAFWLVPELGTDQVLAVGATTLLAAALIVALAVRLRPAPSLLAGGARRARVALTLALSPERQEQLKGVAAQNWSPLYRPARGPHARAARPRRRSATLGRASPFARRGTPSITGSSSPTTTTRATSVSTAPSRAVCGSPTRTERGSSTPTTSTSASRTRPAARSVLFIGLGGGSAPKRMWRDFPALRLQVVELDPDVVDAAYRWFAAPARAPASRIDVSDGRRGSRAIGERWDVIVIDAFYADSIPFHLATREFLELVRERLAPDGVVVVNVIGAVTGDESKLLRSMTKTYRSAFPTVVLLSGLRRPVNDRNPTLHPQRDPRRDRRRGADDGVPAAALAGDPRRRRRLRPTLDGRSPTAGNATVRFDDVPVLTDDYAPTDALLTD